MNNKFSTDDVIIAPNGLRVNHILITCPMRVRVSSGAHPVAYELFPLEPYVYDMTTTYKADIGFIWMINDVDPVCELYNSIPYDRNYNRLSFL